MNNILDSNELLKTTFSKKGFNNFLIALLFFILYMLSIAIAFMTPAKATNSIILSVALPGTTLLVYMIFSVRGTFFSLKSVQKKEPNTAIKIIGIIGNLILVLPVVAFVALIILGIAGVDVWGFMANSVQ